MTWLQALVTILVALIGGFGSSYLSYRQFILKRQDEKEEKNIQKQIDDSIDKAMGRFIAQCGEIGDAQIKKAKEEVRTEFQDGLMMRGEEGRERFEINSKQITENSKMIKEILEIQKEQTSKFDALVDSITALNKVSKACAEGVKSTLYDKIYIVAEKAIRRKGITVDEKANIKQLYDSYSDLNGNSKGSTYANICLHELEVVTEEEARKRDMDLKS